jgi:hypothetical protein
MKLEEKFILYLSIIYTHFIPLHSFIIYSLHFIPLGYKLPYRGLGYYNILLTLVCEYMGAKNNKNQ